MITAVEVEIKGVTYRLTIEEAHDLYLSLNRLFCGYQNTTVYPPLEVPPTSWPKQYPEVTFCKS
jgi:hypothetical protein